MSKVVTIFLVVLMLFSVFTGCKKEEQSTPVTTVKPQTTGLKTFTCNGLTMELPEKFYDYSDSPIGVGHSFLYGSDFMGIMGDEYKKSENEFTSLDEFVQAQADAHSTQAAQKDGFWTITYEDPSQNEPQIYICTFYETQSSYWIISTYCPDIMLEDCQADMWNFATNVRF